MTDLSEIREFWERRTIKFGGKAPVHIGRGRIYNWRMTRVHRKELNEAIDLCKPKSVLEIGVGQGRLLSKVEGASLFGVDISTNMLKKCRLKNKLSNLNLVAAEATHLPFRIGPLIWFTRALSLFMFLAILLKRLFPR